MDQRINTKSLATLPRESYTVSALLTKFSGAFFSAPGKAISPFIWKHKRPQTDRAIQSISTAWFQGILQSQSDRSSKNSDTQITGKGQSTHNYSYLIGGEGRNSDWFLRQGFLCSPDCPGTQSVNQAGLKLHEICMSLLPNCLTNVQLTTICNPRTRDLTLLPVSVDTAWMWCTDIHADKTHKISKSSNDSRTSTQIPQTQKLFRGNMRSTLITSAQGGFLNRIPITQEIWPIIPCKGNCQSN